MAELGDFLRQCLVFLQFALQKAHGDAGLGLNAAGGEEVGVGELVVAVPEVGGLDPAARDQCVDAVVEAADADAEDLGELPLAGLGLLREVLEQAVTQVVAEVTTTLIGVLDTLPPYRVGTVLGAWGPAGGRGEINSHGVNNVI